MLRSEGKYADTPRPEGRYGATCRPDDISLDYLRR